MNCRNFEAIIDDVARGALMDATARDEGLRHAEECGPCGARLSDERSLSAGLRSLASLTAGASAPPRVETALLAAFRERHARAGREESAPAPAPASDNVLVPLASHPRAARSWVPRWAQGAAVAAASALLVFGLYALVRNQSAQQQQTPVADASTSSPTRGEQPTTTAAMAPSVPAAMPSVEELNEDAAGEVDAPRQRQQSVRNNRGTQRHSRPGVLNAGYNRGAAAEPEEIATEFIPLMNGGRLPAGDAGHIMRVEVPRTALASFGLPVNADLQGGRVKADVLIGEDGMARAIRFVR